MPKSSKAIFRFVRLAKFSVMIAVLTMLYSTAVAYLDSGSLLGTVKVKDLHQFGGVTFADLHNFEIWRIVTSQLVHVKPPHMLLNVILLLFTGAFVERTIGPLKTAAIWLIGGGLGTVISPIWIEPPWNVGTGASHATFAFASAALAISALNKTVPFRNVGFALALAVVGSGLALDYLSAGFPKPGHVVSFLIGLIIVLLSAKRDQSASIK